MSDGPVEVPEAPPYAVLGIHGVDVGTVEGNVARVRFFVGDEIVDEDVDLPELPPGVSASEAIYTAMLDEKLRARAAELRKGAT